MTKEMATKEKLLKAFDISDKKTIADVCRIVGVIPSTYYFHFYKDSDFKRQVIEKQKQHLEAKLAAI